MRQADYQMGSYLSDITGINVDAENISLTDIINQGLTPTISSQITGSKDVQQAGFTATINALGKKIAETLMTYPLQSLGVVVVGFFAVRYIGRK
jgi:hypothetical protein